MVIALLAAAGVALCSMSGVLLFGKDGRLVGSHRYVLPVAVGVFLGVIFFELIPETLEMSEDYGAFAILGGFFVFYVLSHLLSTYHHHHHDAHDGCVGTGARMLLLGDAIHNIADGVVVASAFLINPAVGVATTIGIALHEIPQEIAEYGVLVKSGFTRSRALWFNLLSASSIILGVLATWVLKEQAAEYLWVLIGITAGNLLYIATSDLIPELRHSHKDHFWQTLVATLFGITLMFMVLIYTHHLVG